MLNIRGFNNPWIHHNGSWVRNDFTPSDLTAPHRDERHPTATMIKGLTFGHVDMSIRNGVCMYDHLFVFGPGLRNDRRFREADFTTTTFEDRLCFQWRHYDAWVYGDDGTRLFSLDQMRSKFNPPGSWGVVL